MRKPGRLYRPSLTLCASAIALLTASPVAAQTIDQPTEQSWTVRRTWSDKEELGYGAFITAIGRGAATHRCHSLAGCLNDPQINPLFERGARRLQLHADCADVP